MQSRWWFAGLVVLPLVVAGACGGQGKGRPGAVAPPDDDSDLIDVAPFSRPDPANAPAVTPAGLGTSVTGHVQPGTTLTLVATVGDYDVTLAIPKYGASRITDIKMTPFTSLDLEGVTVLAGVLLEPEGLLLESPATLTMAPKGTAKAVAPPSDVAIDLGVAFSGRGDGYHGALVRAEGATRWFRVDHFSGYALAAFSEKGLSDLKAVVGASWEVSLEREIAAKVVDYKMSCGASGCSLGQMSELKEAIRTDLATFYDKVVKPRIVSPYSTPAAVAAAMTKFFGWGHDVGILGMEELFQAEFGEAADALSARIADCIEDAGARCEAAADNIAGETLSFYGGLPPGARAGLADLRTFGRIAALGGHQAEAAAGAYLARCLQTLCTNAAVTAWAAKTCEFQCAPENTAPTTGALSSVSEVATSEIARRSSGVTAGPAFCSAPVDPGLAGTYVREGDPDRGCRGIWFEEWYDPAVGPLPFLTGAPLPAADSFGLTETPSGGFYANVTGVTFNFPVTHSTGHLTGQLPAIDTSSIGESYPEGKCNGHINVFEVRVLERTPDQKYRVEVTLEGNMYGETDIPERQSQTHGVRFVEYPRCTRTFIQKEVKTWKSELPEDVRAVGSCGMRSSMTGPDYILMRPGGRP